MKFASLCVLSFNRAKTMRASLESLWANTRYPYELIILDDGSDAQTKEYLFDVIRQHKASTVVFNTDRNLGIGIAINRGFQIARGDYLWKLDADLMYKPGWLTTVTHLLETYHEIGCMGLFKYWHEPCNFPDELIETLPEYHNVIDFVGSAIGMRRETYERFGKWDELSESFGEDKQFKEAVKEGGLQMAQPLEDVAENVGFGEYKTSLIKEVHMDTGNHVYHLPAKGPLVF